MHLIDTLLPGIFDGTPGARVSCRGSEGTEVVQPHFGMPRGWGLHLIDTLSAYARFGSTSDTVPFAEVADS